MDKALKRLEQLKRELEAAKAAAEQTAALVKASEKATARVANDLHPPRRPRRRTSTSTKKKR